MTALWIWARENSPPSPQNNQTKYKLKINKVLLNLDGNDGKYDILFQGTTVM